MTPPTVTVDAEGTVTGNTYDKYGSTNPVVRRLMSTFERTLGELWTRADPQSVLDVGCGEGVLTHQWAQALGDRRIVGIDLEDPRLQAEWATRQRPNLEYRVTKAERMPFEDGEFDLASAIEVLEHVPDPEHAVAEMARVRLALAARVRAARAALARAEPRARRLRARPRQHARAPQPLEPARLRRAARPSRRGRRGPVAVPLDDAPRPRG